MTEIFEIALHRPCNIRIAWEFVWQLDREYIKLPSGYWMELDFTKEVQNNESAEDRGMGWFATCAGIAQD